MYNTNIPVTDALKFLLVLIKFRGYLEISNIIKLTYMVGIYITCDDDYDDHHPLHFYNRRGGFARRNHTKSPLQQSINGGYQQFWYSLTLSNWFLR